MNSTSNAIKTVSSVAAKTLHHEMSQSIKTHVLQPTELCGSIQERWELLRSRDTVQRSPYFDCEFTKAVARVRNDVRILIAESEDQIISFLPIQENSAGHAVPAGGMLNDWQGIIGDKSPGVLKKMVKDAGLRSFKFHALDNRDSSLKPYYFREFESHYLDLSEGWETYRKWVRKHSSTVKRQGQKTRALEREIGEVRFEFDSDNPDLLERLIELKRAKYQRSKTFDILGVQWAAELLREIHKCRQPNFRGLLSCYWAGEKLVGVHFGMLTKDILHYWFPVYDPQYQRYSPGTEMLMQSAEHACKLGVTKLDLGYGDDAYKFKFCNAHEPVAFGLLNFSRTAHELAKQRYHIRNQLKDIPMKPLVKKLLRGVFPGFGGWNFR